MHVLIRIIHILVTTVAFLISFAERSPRRVGDVTPLSKGVCDPEYSYLCKTITQLSDEALCSPVAIAATARCGTRRVSPLIENSIELPSAQSCCPSTMELRLVRGGSVCNHLFILRFLVSDEKFVKSWDKKYRTLKKLLDKQPYKWYYSTTMLY